MRLKFLSVFLSLGMAMATTATAQLGDYPADTSVAGLAAKHVPGTGFTLHKSKLGTLSLNPYVSFRYLNQMATESTYTDAFGRTKDMDHRNDFQMQKVMLYFRGWLLDPRLRFVLYTWTSNSNMGQGAQVVVAGNMQYKFNDHFDVGGGVMGLPTSRSMLYSWPNWLRVDTRPMAEEFFRGSYSFGVWVQGDIVKNLHYKSALTNNLSQLGIDAGQLDDGFDTWANMVWWTTNDFGKLGPFGDFENHKKPATIIGAAFTRSNETRQSQPGAEDPENTQIRLSDGTGIFAQNAFNTNSQVTAAKYEMGSFNAGVKLRGFSLDGEFFFRWISKMEVTGPIPVSSLFDNGFTAQASAMLIKKTLQAYVTGSYVNGEYGKPTEVVCGLNWFVTKTRICRFNTEVIFTDRSPVGYLAYPTAVGSSGPVFMTNFEVFF